MRPSAALTVVAMAREEKTAGSLCCPRRGKPQPGRTAKGCMQAVVREVTAALQLVPAPVPAPAAGGAPPAWAAPMVANIATLTANVATLTANVATLTASNANQRRCSRNAAAIRRDVDGAGPQPVEMLCKELPGLGVLPAGALPPPVLAAHPPHPGPAVFPPPALHQPATTRISLTGQQISFVQCWYNDTFGIVFGDAVRAHRGAQLERDKLLNFLAGCMANLASQPEVRDWARQAPALQSLHEATGDLTVRAYLGMALGMES
ncbi:hypothetical protein AK812_SmicGene38284 [Symbiodinium microadriaticum]|uniref:Uncharacterized protein n=1 Tax=Symbiodinium microadriaticum TaxID=2951 RepID=A0A1Q9CE59_SYMMI|nr:hypothetical protein AK812_SmicGene38284 [Symbiodinium microadriaticum]